MEVWLCLEPRLRPTLSVLGVVEEPASNAGHLRLPRPLHAANAVRVEAGVGGAFLRAWMAERRRALCVSTFSFQNHTVRNERFLAQKALLVARSAALGACALAARGSNLSKMLEGCLLS